ncbi:unnamed protein product, partial [Vitis vinifera]
MPMGRTRGDKKREEENTSIIFLTIEGYHLSIKMNQFQNEEIELLFGLLCVMESTKRIVPLE